MKGIKLLFLRLVFLFCLAGLAGVGVASLVADYLAAKRPKKVKAYNILLADGGKLSLLGTEIRSNGFCTEILLGNHVDTSVCMASIVTEAIEEQGAQVSPTRSAEVR